MLIYLLYQAMAMRSASLIGKTEVVLLRPQGPKDLEPGSGQVTVCFH